MATGRSFVVITDAGSATLTVGQSFTIPYGSTTTVNIKQAGFDNLTLKSGNNLFAILPNNVNNIFDITSLAKNLVVYNNNATSTANLTIQNTTSSSLQIWKDGVQYQTVNIGQISTYAIEKGSLIELKSSIPYRINGGNYNSNIGFPYSTTLLVDSTILIEQAMFSVSVQNASNVTVQLYRSELGLYNLGQGNSTTFQLRYNDLFQIGSNSDFRIASTDYFPPNKYSLNITNNVSLIINTTSLYVQTGYWNIGYTV